MAYPIELARTLVNELSDAASKNGGDVFVSEIHSDVRGDDYREVMVDINRQDWRRLHNDFVALGWTSYGDDSLVHKLPHNTYIVATPRF